MTLAPASTRELVARYDDPMTATAAKMPDALTAFHWEPQPQAAAFVQKVVDDFLEKLPEAKAFADRLYRETGNRFADLIDTIQLGDDSDLIAEAEAAGWRTTERSCFQVWRQPEGMFPLVASDYCNPAGWIGIDLKVERVADFVFAGLAAGTADVASEDVTGSPGSCWRQVVIQDEQPGRLTAVERHGHAGWQGQDDPDLTHVRDWREIFRLRRRTRERRGVTFPGPFGGSRSMHHRRRSRCCLRPLLRRRARVLATPQHRRSVPEGPSGQARHRLGQSRPPHLPLVPPALSQARRPVGEARLRMPRAVLPRPRGRMGGTGHGAAGLRHRHVQRR